MNTTLTLKHGDTVEITLGSAKTRNLRTLRGEFIGLNFRRLTETHDVVEAKVMTVEGIVCDTRVEKVASLPKMPVAADYNGEARKRFRAGVAAAKRYYAALAAGKMADYCGYIERADARNESSAWYDGFDSIANPDYFAV
jgi:hypothetical protein